VKRRAAEVRPEDLATLIYTSGTTGDPKGVMLTHDNIVSNVHGGLAAFGDFGPRDLALSFLPLCHIFERMGGHYLLLQQGVTIAYAESVEKVPANMAEVRPTLMLSVPRLYEKMYARVNEKVAADSPLKQRIFRWALGVGRKVFQAQVEHRAPGVLLRAQHALADRLCSRPSGPHGRPPPALHLRRRAPGPRDRRVLRRRRPPHPGGLRPHGDEPRDRRSTGRTR
jgi:long-chain acyl-CoA synthetase